MLTSKKFRILSSLSELYPIGVCQDDKPGGDLGLVPRISVVAGFSGGNAQTMVGSELLSHGFRPGYSVGGQ